MVSTVKVLDIQGWWKVQNSVYMAEYNEGFAKKKPANVERGKVACDMVVMFLRSCF